MTIGYKSKSPINFNSSKIKVRWIIWVEFRFVVFWGCIYNVDVRFIFVIFLIVFSKKWSHRYYLTCTCSPKKILADVKCDQHIFATKLMSIYLHNICKYKWYTYLLARYHGFPCTTLTTTLPLDNCSIMHVLTKMHCSLRPFSLANMWVP
jgi:hypothetical protein